MMLSKNLLIWEKWRPKSLSDLVLPSRIYKNFENGITKNCIFHGHYGTGKTSLARIIIGKYTKDKAYLEINSSLHTSIDTLRNEVEIFCKTIPMMDTNDPIKYVFLDEFERVSIQYQDALKAFIEQYHSNVRFIITTNHLNKISDGIKSRFALINFDPESLEEEKEIKKLIFERMQFISLEEKIDIPKKSLAQIINSKFPDFRGMLVSLQNFKETGDDKSESSTHSLKMELFNVIYDKSMNYESIYHFLMSKFGQDKIDIMINLLGRDFINWSLSDKKENIDKLFKLNNVISDYAPKLETSTTDPIILGMTILGKYREILLN